MSANDPIEQHLKKQETHTSTDLYPDTLYILPLPDKPLFPGQNVPLFPRGEEQQRCVELAAEADDPLIALVALRPLEADELTYDRFYNMGTLCRLHLVDETSERKNYVVEGIRRVKIKGWLTTEGPFQAEVEYPEETELSPTRLATLVKQLRKRIDELIPMHPRFSEEMELLSNSIGNHYPQQMADVGATLTCANREQLQQILETVDLGRRFSRVEKLIREDLDMYRKRHDEALPLDSEARREALREQMLAIQRELGIGGEKADDINRFEALRRNPAIPAKVKERLGEEVSRLSTLESGSAEYGVARGYLNWLAGLPWGKETKDEFDLERARRVLDREHYGLEDVKRRIIEFLAVGAKRGSVGGSVILLVGPPGVGKTSIALSIANVLKREFYRFSLGGMRDEAEIKGHRRTYVGAMPGKFIQALKDCGSMNPVIVLDEIDKIGNNYKGDPASAMLEVLDPAQNVDFLDHYLDVRVDLSKSLFICTANDLSTIPDALLDRMEVIRLSGYLTEEKVNIARKHIWPKMLKNDGVKPSELSITAPALKHVVEGYAREHGVRNVEKQLGRLIRKGVVDMGSGKPTPIKIGVPEVEEYLGPPVFTNSLPKTGVGMITGLAWTSHGGATLAIEAALIPRKDLRLKMTGYLGQVMTESAEIAYSYVLSQLARYGVDPQVFDNACVHMHVSEGAVPKDGPSAGITIASALLSLAMNKKTLRPVTMTGELTLTGQVLPVGGIREKIIAAKRLNLTEMILPADNRRDIDKLPDAVRKGLTVHFAEHFSEVAEILFGV